MMAQGDSPKIEEGARKGLQQRDRLNDGGAQMAAAVRQDRQQEREKNCNSAITAKAGDRQTLKKRNSLNCSSTKGVR